MNNSHNTNSPWSIYNNDIQSSISYSKGFVEKLKCTRMRKKLFAAFIHGYNFMMLMRKKGIIKNIFPIFLCFIASSSAAHTTTTPNKASGTLWIYLAHILFISRSTGNKTWSINLMHFIYASPSFKAHYFAIWFRKEKIWKKFLFTIVVHNSDHKMPFTCVRICCWKFFRCNFIMAM